MLALLAPVSGHAEMFQTQEWNGSIGISHQRQLVDNETTNISTRLIMETGTQYHLWQPWFLTGTIRFNLSTDADTDADSKRDTNNLGGKFTANILPVSRFPLSLGYSKKELDISDSFNALNISGTIVPSTSTTTTNYFVTQKYLGKRLKITARISEDMNENSVTGKSTISTSEIDLVHRIPHNDLSFKAMQREQQKNRSDESMDNTLLLLSQKYYPSQNFSVTTNASSLEQHEMVLRDGTSTLVQYVNNIDQVSSVINWRSNDNKTMVIGNLRYTGLDTGEVDMRYINISNNAGVSLRHRFTRNLNASASTSYNTTEIEQSKNTSRNYSAGVSYSGDQIEISGYQYDWSTGLKHEYAETDTTSTSSNTADLSHYISRNWALDKKARINFSVNQALSYQTASHSATTESLNQGARVGYNGSHNNGTQFIQLSFNETRQLKSSDLGQQLNLQYSRQQNLSSRSSITGSLTHQQTLSNYADTDSRSSSNAALLRYSLAKSFSYQVLTFSSALSVSDKQSNISGNNLRYSWDNMLSHKIGQLASSLMIRTQNIDDRQTSSILLSVKRIF